jgi:hypothetical protein
VKPVTSIAVAISQTNSIWGNLFDNMTSATRASSMPTDYYIYKVRCQDDSCLTLAKKINGLIDTKQHNFSRLSLRNFLKTLS